MDVLLLIVAGAVNLCCFAVGAKIGQTVVQGRDLELPRLPNPIVGVQRIRESRKADREQERMETILSNVERYDGTGMGQKDVSGR